MRVAFRDGLRRLHDELQGEARLDTMEHWLAVAVIADGRGHFRAKCEMRDQAGMGNVLSFELEFDQTVMPAMLSELDAIIDAYPVVGRR